MALGTTALEYGSRSTVGSREIVAGKYGRTLSSGDSETRDVAKRRKEGKKCIVECPVKEKEEGSLRRGRKVEEGKGREVARGLRGHEWTREGQGRVESRFLGADD